MLILLYISVIRNRENINNKYNDRNHAYIHRMLLSFLASNCELTVKLKFH